MEFQELHISVVAVVVDMSAAGAARLLLLLLLLMGLFEFNIEECVSKQVDGWEIDK